MHATGNKIASLVSVSFWGSLKASSFFIFKIEKGNYFSSFIRMFPIFETIKKCYTFHNPTTLIWLNFYIQNRQNNIDFKLLQKESLKTPLPSILLVCVPGKMRVSSVLQLVKPTITFEPIPHFQ